MRVRAVSDDHSGLMPANLMTFAHFSTSVLMNFWHSEGVKGIGLSPRSASRVLSLETSDELANCGHIW